MKIALASDHAGFAYKEKIKSYLAESGYEVRDFSTTSEAPADDPAFIRPTAEAVGRVEPEALARFESEVARKLRSLLRKIIPWTSR